MVSRDWSRLPIGPNRSPAMTNHLAPLNRWAFTLVALAVGFGFVSDLVADDREAAGLQATDPIEPAAEDSNESAPPDASVAKPDQLRFSFNGVPWREVIKWLADESELALHVDGLPSGSFTYSDPSAFTSQEAIDRVNLFLLSEGYTLVQSGRLLSVVDLGDPRSVQKLDALARTISVDELASANEHDVVKCMFALGEISAEEAVQELSALKLLSPPTVLSKTNQLLITDTVGKLRSVKRVLDAFEPSQMTNGTVVKSFSLQHVNAEDVLLVARPHLGLATGEMIGIDVSISADLQGKNIFVTGVEDKVALIEGIVKSVDQPRQLMSTEEGAMELRSHLVPGGNVETVYNVLQTLLAGKSIRLSMDETAGSVVALASPSIQSEIAQTVAQLQAADAEFEVIPLKNVDPYLAVSLIEQMLKLPGPMTDRDDIDPNSPQIDADPGNRRLFVRAKKPQIDQIKKIVSGLETGGDTVEKSEVTRVIPLQGAEAQLLLETAAKFWRDKNPILLFPSVLPGTDEVQERVPGEDSSTKPESDTQTRASMASYSAGSSLTSIVSAESSADDFAPRLLTMNANAKSPAIRCQMTPRGLLLQCDDTAALDRLEEHLRAIAGPADTLPSPPVVFYLKHTKPEDALRMLGELIDGGEAAKESQTGTLVNGYVSSGSMNGFLSSFVTSQEGTTTMMAGAITVVADSRLNRLIAQGTTADIALIENYLKIIDKDTSITSIETYGSSHVIELEHSEAADVAEAIREAFANRVLKEQSQGQSGSSSSGQVAQREEPSRDDDDDDDRSRGLRTPPPAPRSLEPKFTVAVHEASNSLIVTAPDQLFSEIEKLVDVIDSRGEKYVEVITPSNGAVYEAVLQQVLLGQPSSGRDSSRGSSTSNRSTSSRSNSSRSSSSRSSSGGSSSSRSR